MSILAVSGQQAIGVGIGIAIVVGWAIYALVTSARPDRGPGSEVETAPNRKPYLDDDAMEGPRLDRVLSWGLLTMAFVAVALPVYWLREPSRQEGAERGFEHRAVERGAVLYQSTAAPLEPGRIAAGCADCHGNAGQGGAVQFILQGADPDNPDRVIPVSWDAPALNDVFLRFSEEEVREILVFGRPPTPMPAWGVEGGGALGPQQIDDLLAFLRSIQITSAEAKEQAADLGTDGERLFEAFCARCHTLGWSYRDSYEEPAALPGGGALGPSLRDGATLRQFPSREDHIAFITEGSEYGKNYGRRGIGGKESGGMPGFGQMLSEEQIAAIVDYERSL